MDLHYFHDMLHIAGWLATGNPAAEITCPVEGNCPVPGATSKHSGGYTATNTAYYKLHKLQVGWIFVIFSDFNGFSLIFIAGGLRLHAPAFGNSSGG